MGTAARLSGYLAVLALLRGVAWWVGAATGEPGSPPADTVADGAGDGHSGGHTESSATVESAGVLAFQHGGVVRTTEFTVATGAGR
jgi:hypothetical protein